jgi:hypothetical protein
VVCAGPVTVILKVWHISSTRSELAH